MQCLKYQSTLNDTALVLTCLKVNNSAERNHLFVVQMAHFPEVVQDKAEPRCSLEDGVRAMELVLEAKS